MGEGGQSRLVKGGGRRDDHRGGRGGGSGIFITWSSVLYLGPG